MKGYTSRQEIENYLLITVDPSFHAQIDDWIGQMEIHIDQTTGRNFIADSVASARKYDGNSERELMIDDCVAVTEVKIGDDAALTYGTDEDYILYPANELPYTKIRLTGGLFLWDGVGQNVSVKGKWGYSVAVPADIKFAATVLVAGIINYSLNAEGEIKSESIGRYSVTYKDEKQWQDFDRVSDILGSYHKFNF